MDKINIAIDGHSSCGKSTMAKALASRIGYIYIDTGAMYRGVTLYSLRHDLWQPIDESEAETAKDDPFVVRHRRLDVERLIADLPKIRLTFGRVNGQNRLFLNGEDVELDIRSMKVSSHVSPVSTIPEVRQALVSQQQSMARHKGVVMDGRDIGTVVLPDAELKVFVTARPEIRAQRRLDELHGKGIKDITFEEVHANVLERDRIDSTRATSPLKQAPDARLLDNSDLTISEQDKKLYQWYLTAAMKSAAEI